MSSFIQELLVIFFGAGLGVFGTIWTTKRRENISTKKEQLQYFYAPLEILLRMNAKGYQRYKVKSATAHDREFIETNIWYPNHIKTKELIMNNSHHLSSMPNEVLDLLDHINVWLSVYELKHIKGQHTGPVYAGPKGARYPKESDQFVYQTADRLRRELNKN